MKLMTKEILDAFKKQKNVSDMEAKDIKVIAKFFTPWGAASWFAAQYDEKDGIFFGFVNLGDDQCAELGDWSLSEMTSLRGMGGLTVERDKWFPVGKYSLQDIIDANGHSENLK
jgi:hypothetical protein